MRFGIMKMILTNHPWHPHIIVNGIILKIMAIMRMNMDDKYDSHYFWNANHYAYHQRSCCRGHYDYNWANFQWYHDFHKPNLTSSQLWKWFWPPSSIIILSVDMFMFIMIVVVVFMMALMIVISVIIILSRLGREYKTTCHLDNHHNHYDHHHSHNHCRMCAHYCDRHHSRRHDLEMLSFIVLHYNHSITSTTNTNPLYCDLDSAVSPLSHKDSFKSDAQPSTPLFSSHYQLHKPLWLQLSF